MAIIDFIVYFIAGYTQFIDVDNDNIVTGINMRCLLYTSDAADERSSVDLGGRRIIKKKKETYIAKPWPLIHE